MAFAPALLAPPDEQTQDAATVATALDPVAVAESQVLPPPLPAAPALPPDALMALASAPPPVAPQTPVDVALAPTLPPAGGPALSVLPPPDVAAGTPGTPVEAAQKRVAEVDALGREIQQLGDERTDLEKQQADQKAQLANERQAALSKLQERQELHRTQAANTVAELRSKAESEPYHTFWESRSIGQNIATGIGLILGGVSWNAGHVNRGIQIVENMMAQDLALQKEKHAELWRAVEAAERGERALDSRELRETAAFSAAQGAKADAIAGRLGAMIAANKGKGDTATAKKAMLTLAMQADQHYQNATSAEAAAAHLKEMDEETARHHREQEATSLLRAQKYKTKGGGAGGGGLGSRVDQAAVKLRQGIEDAKAGKEVRDVKGAVINPGGTPLTGGQIDAYGVALGIPLKPTKTVKTSVASILDEVHKQAVADRAEAGVATKGTEKRIDFDEGVRSLNTLIAQIEKSPAAWDKYRENAKAWERNKGLRESGIGKGLQFVGGMNLRQEEGLKGDPAALTLFQRQERLNTSIAKGFGGVITEGDRQAAASNQANFALTSAEKLAQLREMRDNMKKKFKVATGQEWTPSDGGPAPAASTKFPPRIKDGVRFVYDEAKGKYVEDRITL